LRRAGDFRSSRSPAKVGPNSLRGEPIVSLQPTPIGPVPKETARVAHAAFPTGNMCVQLRDELGRVYEDASFSSLVPSRGQPPEAPWRLAMVTVLQFAEGLSDRQAADAVRGRIDWKYLLGLELTDPGFDHTVLSEFRTRLVDGHSELVLLNALLDRSRELGLFRPRVVNVRTPLTC